MHLVGKRATAQLRLVLQVGSDFARDC